jgi:enterochelin esterase-like enzyme
MIPRSGLSLRRTKARSLAALWLTLVGCSRPEPPGAAPKAHASVTVRAPLIASAQAQATGAASVKPTLPPVAGTELTWTYEKSAVGRMNVVVLIPDHAANEKLPVLITMHGRGEALKGPERGARGWVDDYELPKIIDRVRRPPLVREDFKSFVEAPRLERLNHALSEKPYRGLIIVCPYTPDMLTGDDPFSKAPPLARFIVDELLPRVYRETPALGTVATTAIDGVSLGGRAAYSVGLLRPQAFGVIAALQAAFHGDHAGDITARARRAKAENPSLVFRMLTSDGDYFLEANTAIARSMKAAGLPIYFDIVQGPHDYDFNRGPGAIEMLLFHDRVLRGEPPP